MWKLIKRPKRDNETNQVIGKFADIEFCRAVLSVLEHWGHQLSNEFGVHEGVAARGPRITLGHIPLQVNFFDLFLENKNKIFTNLKIGRKFNLSIGRRENTFENG